MENSFNNIHNFDNFPNQMKKLLELKLFHIEI